MKFLQNHYVELLYTNLQQQSWLLIALLWESNFCRSLILSNIDVQLMQVITLMQYNDVQCFCCILMTMTIKTNESELQWKAFLLKEKTLNW